MVWWPKRGRRARATRQEKVKQSKLAREVKAADANRAAADRLNMKHFRFHALGRGMHLDASTEKRGKRLFCSLQLPLRRGARGAGGPGGLVEGRDLVDGLKVK